MSRIRKTVEDYQNLAVQHGFKWIGLLPKDTNCLTTWECSKGHRFETKYSHIKDGQGCKLCWLETRRKKYDDYIKLANERGFKWIGPEVQRTDKKTEWECSKGHRWESGFNTIQQGSGCPHCYNHRHPISLRQYHLLASKRGFKWIGPEVSTVLTKTWWECSKGHRWEAQYSAIKRTGCPLCYAESIRVSVSQYHEAAKNRNFQWLGPEVPNVETDTWWKCKKGHKWKANYHAVSRGTGCPVCMESKGEAIIAKVLSSYNIEFTRQKRFDACRAKNPLPFDFYFQLGDTHVLIEYDGEHHFGPIKGWREQGAFEKTKLYDSIKDTFALKYGFCLIRIPFTESDIEGYLIARLNKQLGTELKPIERLRHKTKLPTDNYVQSNLF